MVHGNINHGDELRLPFWTRVQVKMIRKIPSPLKRKQANHIGEFFGIHPSYVYHLRNPKYQKWKYL